MRVRNDKGYLCSKGATKCFGSVKRVKQLSKKYFNEAFKKRSINQQHTASGVSLNRDASISDDDTAVGAHTSSKKYGLKKSVFFADVPPPKYARGHDRNSTISLKPIGQITPNLGRNTNIMSMNL